MSRLRRNEKVVILGVFALGLAAMLGILIAPLAFAQQTAFTPAAQLSHTISVQPNVTKPIYVPMNSNDYINGGITHSSTRNPADIIINQDGTYLIVAAGQVGKISGSTTCNVDLWLSQNGEYVANSNTRSSVNAVNDTIVLVSQAIMPLKANDIINTVMSVSAANQGCGLINTASSSEPNIPAIIFSLVRIGS
ncbi:MAG: hypothetical protein QOK51_07235 [Nitrososphaeraceae archaeon]|nr:hypothetical protein [Nitrososphaeraceae archaeon]MDW0182764.1 hypothetical protein [Nitrososphaeraceae archaeon]MDW0185821.1 hypothetical protein [Nitrososphaeraceae archaeon]MDW0203614.1 hypothetical protein [Nitrososphaeraceae archaeon]MDW0214689.1 hypothetical protein [Nitrososphaeraceae archaeon]